MPQPEPRPRPVQPQVRPRDQPTMIHRPPRNRSNGSIQSQDPYRRPPSSHLTPPTVARQPQPANPGRITPVGNARTFPTNPARLQIYVHYVTAQHVTLHYVTSYEIILLRNTFFNLFVP